MAMRLQFEIFDNKELAQLPLNGDGEYESDDAYELPSVSIGNISNCYSLTKLFTGIIAAPDDDAFFNRPVTKEQLELFHSKLTDSTEYQFNPVKDMVERALKVDFDKFTLLVTWC